MNMLLLIALIYHSAFVISFFLCLIDGLSLGLGLGLDLLRYMVLVISGLCTKESVRPCSMGEIMNWIYQNQYAQTSLIHFQNYIPDSKWVSIGGGRHMLSSQILFYVLCFDYRPMWPNYSLRYKIVATMCSWRFWGLATIVYWFLLKQREGKYLTNWCI